jgi:pyruvate/2-oxoglutarate/acetoin dehydrogenase E1 component
MIEKIYRSVKKTGKLIILDNSSHKICSMGSEIISELISLKKDLFKKEPIYLALPDIPSPASFYLTKKYYNTSQKILKSIGRLVNKKIDFKNNEVFHDIPDPAFKGPF